MAAGARLIDSMYLAGAGTAAASGTVNFYGVGTLVPAVVYADDTLSTPLTQPITLDASGKLPSPVYTATPLRMIVKSSAGTTLYDVARIDGDRAELVGVSNAAWTATDLNSVLTAVQSSLGGTDARFLAPAKFAEVQLSVKDFGAAGNGIADDTVPIQAALTACSVLGGGTVLVPAGAFLASSVLTIPAGVALIGASSTTAIIRNTNASGLAITTSGTGTVSISNLTVSHSSSSTQAAITAISTVRCIVSGVVISGHNVGVSAAAATSAPPHVIERSSITVTGAASVGVALGTGVVTSSYISGAVTGISGSVIGGMVVAQGVVFSGQTTAVSVTAGHGVMIGCSAFTTGTTTLDVGASAGDIAEFGNVNMIAKIQDARTGAPVNFSFAVNGSISPTNETTAIRAVGTAGGITITINAMTSVTGWGRKWSLICSNTSGGAVTWTFNAQYVLSAAVNPATGNRVNLLLEYNPVDNKVYEISRAATAN